MNPIELAHFRSKVDILEFKELMALNPGVKEGDYLRELLTWGTDDWYILDKGLVLKALKVKVASFLKGSGISEKASQKAIWEEASRMASYVGFSAQELFSDPSMSELVGLLVQTRGDSQEKLLKSILPPIPIYEAKSIEENYPGAPVIVHRPWAMKIIYLREKRLTDK